MNSLESFISLIWIKYQQVSQAAIVLLKIS